MKYRVGFESPGITAPVVDKLPGWHPVVGPAPPFAFGAVVAMCETRETAELLAKALNERGVMRYRDTTDMRAFFHDQAEWSRATFGSDQERGPIGPLKHLAKEVQEVLAEPHNIEEYADLVFLVFDACRRAGFSYDALLLACWFKLGKNKMRKWPKPTSSDEPVEHDRGAE